MFEKNMGRKCYFIFIVSYVISLGIIRLASVFSSVGDSIFKNPQDLQHTQPPKTTGGGVGRMPQKFQKCLKLAKKPWVCSSNLAAFR